MNLQPAAAPQPEALGASPLLPRVQPAIAAAQRRVLARAALHRGPLGLKFSPAPRLAQGLRLGLRLAGHRFELALDNPALLGTGAALLQQDMPAALRCAFVAQRAGPLLQALAAALGTTPELDWADAWGPLPKADGAIGLQIQHGPGALRCRAHLAALDAAGWDWLASAAQSLLPPRPLAAVPLPCRAVLGGATLPPRDLRALECGDVLVVQRLQAGAGLVCALTLGASRLAVGWTRLEDGRLHLQRLHWNEQRNLVMSDTLVPTPALDAVPAGLDEAVALSLRFELPPWTTTLGELGGLAAGAVIDTGSDLREAPVTLWIERRCIGHGHLVALGDRLGLQIDSLSWQAGVAG